MLSVDKFRDEKLGFGRGWEDQTFQPSGRHRIHGEIQSAFRKGFYPTAKVLKVIDRTARLKHKSKANAIISGGDRRRYRETASDETMRGDYRRPRGGEGWR